MKRFRILPTLLTLANGVCGFASITVAAKLTGSDLGVGDYHYLTLAGWLIFAAMLFDMLDGHVARAVKCTSDFGEQLDSMCDLITFGVAPAFLMIQLGSASHYYVLWIPSAFYVVCAVLRLARFNCESAQTLNNHLMFSGLPTTAAGGTIAAYAVALPGPISRSFLFGAVSPSVSLLPLFMAVMAILMVSRVSYPHIVNHILQERHPIRDALMLLGAALVTLVLREKALPLLFSVFVLSAPLRSVAAVTLLRYPRKGPIA